MKLQELIHESTELIDIDLGDRGLTTLLDNPAFTHPGIINNVHCSHNKLTSLVGCPREIHGSFRCSFNPLESLIGCPLIVGKHFSCANTKLTSLKNVNKYLKKMNGEFSAVGNKLTHNLVGLLLIEGITGVYLDNEDIEYILNKHIKQPNKKLAMLQCQQELIEAGFEDAAQL